MICAPLGKKYSMLALLLCLASASPWACRPGSAQILVVQLRLEGLDDDAEGAGLRAAVLHKLRATPRLVVQAEGEGGGDGPEVALSVRLMGRGLRVRMAPAAGGGVPFEAVVPLQPQAGLHGAVTDSLGVALEAIFAMQKANAGGPQALRAALAPQAPSHQRPQVAFNLRSFAVRRLAHLRDPGAAEGLRALVTRGSDPDATNEDEALALQAVGSLVALGDTQAVLPMIALTRHKSATFVVQMAHAIGALGGPMAEAYLVTLASGHLDAEVRQGAATALDELGRRGAGD
jgi:hypothetical protein